VGKKIEILNDDSNMEYYGRKDFKRLSKNRKKTKSGIALLW
jgi:hypothetical protein